MNKLFRNAIEKMFNAKIYADHAAIKGKKSTGAEDYSAYNNWKPKTGSTQTT